MLKIKQLDGIFSDIKITMETAVTLNACYNVKGTKENKNYSKTKERICLQTRKF